MSKNTKQVKKFKTKFISSIFLLDLITIIILYLIMPTIQGYPPYSEDFAFQAKVQPLTHIEQYTAILLIGMTLNIISLKLYMKRIYAYINKTDKKEDIKYEEILKVRKDCINVPYKLALFEFFGILILGLLLNLVMLAQPFAVVKFTLMIISLASITALSVLIISQKYLYNILESTYIKDKRYERNNGIRIKNSLSLQIQMLPFVLVVLILISLVGYSKAMNKQGETITSYYKAYLEAEEEKMNNINIDSLKQFLDKIPVYNKSDYYFIITPNDETIYVSDKDGSISSFVLDYRDFFFQKTDGRLYENFGIDEQLYAKKVLDSNGKIWYIGFKFKVVDYELFIYYLLIDVIVLALYSMLSYIWAKNMSKNSNKISEKLKKILNTNTLDKENILPVMSNDELGDLSYYYNKIQEKLINQQDIISIQSKFTAVGEVAVGMAHDINSPASAIEGTVNLLYDFKVEDNEEEYKLLLDNMKVAIEKILKLVNNAREQFRNHDNLSKEEFDLDELLMSMKNAEETAIIKERCSIEINTEKGIKIYGIKSKLYQVIVNLVRNSLNAYKDNKLQGKITIEAEENKNEIVIKVIDNAGGIPEQIKDQLFNKILTTRGTKGTGLRIIFSLKYNRI